MDENFVFKPTRGDKTSTEDTTTSLKALKFFRTKNPEFLKELGGRANFTKIVRLINTQYLLYAVETGEFVKLPFGLGSFAVAKRTLKKKFNPETCKLELKREVNWVETIKAQKIVYFLNQNTNGVFCRWMWYKDKSSIMFPNIWSLSFSKPARKLLHKSLIDEEKDAISKYRNLFSIRKL